MSLMGSNTKIENPSYLNGNIIKGSVLQSCAKMNFLTFPIFLSEAVL